MDEREKWTAAWLLFEERGDMAALEAAMEADESIEAGDMDAAREWTRIMTAVIDLSATAADGAKVH
jgi:hypothetical protein